MTESATQQITTIKSIIKRDGLVVDFNLNKITESIFQAAESVGGKDQELAKNLSLKVLELLQKKFKEKIPTVDDVQDVVEKTLIEEGHAKTAKAFILYRHKKDQDREQRALIIGSENEDANLNFSNEALKILERRYLLKNPEGQVIETPKGMLMRVAKNIAAADKMYKADEEQIKKTEEEFYSIMAELKFLPNSPTLMNAVTITQQL
ncbi:MAG: ribonucleotide reductase N-terminal alpha domain-containing protein, partial [Nanoarchaeota archaeon]